jgi:alginate O-acetyltransferase complex protein AlgJ
MPYERRSPAPGRRADILLIVGFFAILLYPSLSLFENPETLKARGVLENRTLTARPPIWRLAMEPSKFVADFKSFFEDQFEGRGPLVTFNSLIRYSLFQTSTNAYVVAGRRGALFYTGEAFVPRHDFGNEVAKYRRVLPVTENRIRRLHDFLLSRKKWAEEMGAEFLFVVAPDKSSIYPELLPGWLDRLDGPTLTDKLVAHLEATADVNFIDLRPSLERAKQPGHPLYYLSDTHWNHEGALVGFNEIVRRLQTKFPAIEGLKEEDLIRARVRYGGDLAHMLHLGTYLAEPTLVLNVKSPRSKAVPFPYDATPVPTWDKPPAAYQVADPRLPKALIYHDSFMERLTPYITECFQSTVFIRDRCVVKNTVKGYKPDIVILECVERSLYPLAYRVDELLPVMEPAMVAENAEQLGTRRR